MRTCRPAQLPAVQPEVQHQSARLRCRRFPRCDAAHSRPQEHTCLGIRPCFRFPLLDRRQVTRHSSKPGQWNSGESLALQNWHLLEQAFPKCSFTDEFSWQGVDDWTKLFNITFPFLSGFLYICSEVCIWAI